VILQIGNAHPRAPGVSPLPICKINAGRGPAPGDTPPSAAG
jgi:hypothetical protein